MGMQVRDQPGRAETVLNGAVGRSAASCGPTDWARRGGAEWDVTGRID